jgi:hypothetical protein
MLKSEINSREKEEKSEALKEQRVYSRLKFRVRFDYKGKPRPARFFFGGKRTENVAQELRDQQVALWKNVPLQGINIENMDLGEVYSVYDEEMDEEIAFAPLELIVSCDSLEDLLRFVFREEFRRIEILEPGNLLLSGKEIERLLFKMNELFHNRLMLRLRESR